MTRYRDDFDCPVVFEEQVVEDTLAEVLAEHGLPPTPCRRDREVRARHLLPERRPRAGVGRRDAHPRALAAGRRHVRPEAGDVSGRGGRTLRDRGPNGYAFAVVNYANPDMVGHTGVIPAVVRAVEATDAALGTTLAAVEALAESAS